MKKILLTILAVLAMSGMAVAQTAPSDINLHRNEDGSWSFIMPGRNLVMSTESFSTNDTVNGHYLAGVPEGWLILALGDTVPVSNDSLRRTTPITEGTPVTIVPTGNLRRIKSITLVDEAPAGPPSWKLTLSSPAKDLCIIANGGVIAQHTLDVASTEFTVEMPELTSQTVDIFATDGSGNCWYCTQENMSFAIGQTYQSSPTMTALDDDNSKPLYKITATSDVTIPADKTVVLSGVNISSGSITCSGNVTMILLGSNSVTTATNEKAAIKIGGSGTTLTITGSGSLTAQGGQSAAGIGTDRNGTGGNIVINGGTVTATGGSNGGAGIGTGLSITSGGSNTCGAITIGTGVTMVTATKGSGAPNSIGNGQADFGGTQTCGTITIGGDATTYATGVTTSPFTYEPSGN